MGLRHSRTSRAVSMSMKFGAPGVLGVQPDRFDNEVESIGAVDLARYAVGLAGPDEQGFAEVVQPVDAQGIEVLQQEHRTCRALRPREQEQMIGAEVKHGRAAERERMLPLHRQRR